MDKIESCPPIFSPLNIQIHNSQYASKMGCKFHIDVNITLTSGCTVPRFLFCAHDCVLSYRYSVVVEGERGNRPHIYCLEQLLQEAVSTPHCPTPFVDPHTRYGSPQRACVFYSRHTPQFPLSANRPGARCNIEAV